MDPLQLNKQLKQAVLFSDINKVTELLKNGASASIRVNADAGNLLHHTNDPQIADLLIKNGACVDARNRYRLTPLFLAVKHNNVALTRILLQYNATTSCTDLKFKYTPLHIAAAAGNLDIVRLLLDFRSFVNATQNMYCNTPLHCALAAKKVNLDVVRLLLLEGADVGIVNAINDLPIIVALKNSCCPPCVIKMLIYCGTPISFKCLSGNGGTLLHYAVLSACIKKVEILLKFGSSIFQYNSHGENVLHIALSKHGNLEIVKMLLERSYKIDTYSTMTLKSEIDEFLRAKEYVNKISPTGMTALHAALLYRAEIKVDLFKELLKHGADISVEYKGKSSYSIALQRARDFTERLHKFDICKKYPEAFLKYKRDKESMDEILKLFVKYSIPNPEFDKSILRFIECPSFLSDFLYECNAELLLIEKELNVSNLFEFLNSRDSTFRLGSKMLEMCISDTFPIYKDVMKEKLRRSCMLDKLCDMKIYVNSENGRKRLYLNWISTTILVKYLSDNDLFNLIVAFYIVL